MPADAHPRIGPVGLMPDEHDTALVVVQPQPTSAFFTATPKQFGTEVLEYIILRLLSSDVGALDLRGLTSNTTREQRARLRDAILACKGLGVLWFGPPNLFMDDDAPAFLRTLVVQNTALRELFLSMPRQQTSGLSVATALISAVHARNLRKLIVSPMLAHGHRDPQIEALQRLLYYSESLRDFEIYIDHRAHPDEVDHLARVLGVGYALRDSGLTRFRAWEVTPPRAWHESSTIRAHPRFASDTVLTRYFDMDEPHDGLDGHTVRRPRDAEIKHSPPDPEFHARWPNELRARAWEAARATEGSNPLPPDTGHLRAQRPLNAATAHSPASDAPAVGTRRRAPLQSHRSGRASRGPPSAHEQSLALMKLADDDDLGL